MSFKIITHLPSIITPSLVATGKLKCNIDTAMSHLSLRPVQRITYILVSLSLEETQIDMTVFNAGSYVEKLLLISLYRLSCSFSFV